MADAIMDELAMEEMIIQREVLKKEVTRMVSSYLEHFDSLREDIARYKTNTDDSLKMHATIHRMTQQLMLQLQAELDSVEKLKRQRVSEKNLVMETMESNVHKITQKVAKLESDLLEKKEILAAKKAKIVLKEKALSEAEAEEDERKRVLSSSAAEHSRQHIANPCTPPGKCLEAWTERILRKQKEMEQRELEEKLKIAQAAEKREGREYRRRLQRLQEEHNDLYKIPNLLQGGRSPSFRLQRIKENMDCIRKLNEEMSPRHALHDLIKKK